MAIFLLTQSCRILAPKCKNDCFTLAQSDKQSIIKKKICLRRFLEHPINGSKVNEQKKSVHLKALYLRQLAAPRVQNETSENPQVRNSAIV
jgi:hypothetical protein